MARTITVTAADVDLFHVAAREMSDSTQWHLIARANGLTDPRISGMMQLTIPVADPSQTGGVPAQS